MHCLKRFSIKILSLLFFIAGGGVYSSRDSISPPEDPVSNSIGLDSINNVITGDGTLTLPDDQTASIQFGRGASLEITGEFTGKLQPHPGCKLVLTQKANDPQ
jgi:hypothetical protein